MSVFRSRPALRWLVPSAAAAVIIGGGAAAGTIVASADPSLPERSAAQLLVDVQNARVAGFSGTIVQSADLGLPAIPGVTGEQGNADLIRLIAGSNTARVWYAGEQKARLALMSALGETDVIRNGSDVWLWRSAEKTATHLRLAPDATEHEALPPGAGATPQQAAAAALAAIDPTTVVSTTGAAKVAGRDAYELVLSPRDTASLIGQVRLAIDAKEHLPLRVDVYAKNAASPAVRVAFQQISFTVPDAQQFVFKAPPGTKVTESSARDAETSAATGAQKRAEALKKAEALRRVQEKSPAQRPNRADGPKVIGKGWTTIVTAKVPAAKDLQNAQVQSVLNALPKVSGAWGGGRLFAGSLFSVLLTDDGRIFAGAVAPEALYQAAAR